MSYGINVFIIMHIGAHLFKAIHLTPEVLMGKTDIAADWEDIV